MKVALVHDDLIQQGGAERLFQSLVSLWPEAVIFTTIISNHWERTFAGREIRTSFMQSWPLKDRFYRNYFLFYPLALESFDFSDFDLVISSSSRFAHGIITRPETLHLAYINSPGRMFWESSRYLDFSSSAAGLIFLTQPFLSALRLWDYTAAQRPDFLIANSKTPKERIKKYWQRAATVIYPFADLRRFSKDPSTEFIPPLAGLPPKAYAFRRAGGMTNNPKLAKDYFLIVSRLVSWKRIDLAVTACRNLGLPLVIIGSGPDETRLRALADSKTIFTGRLSDDLVVDFYKNCRALILTQEEDFGITAIEAMAAGKPVIAYKSGGALETVIEGRTGEFFYPQTAPALSKVLAGFNGENYDREVCRKQAAVFSEERFLEAFKNFVEIKWSEFFQRRFIIPR